MNCNTYFDKKIEIKEAICLMETKINELVEMYNRIDADHAIIAEKVAELEKLVDYLLGTGLAEEVKKKLEEWLADGTLADIIGDTLDKWTARIDDIANNKLPQLQGQLDNIELCVDNFNGSNDYEKIQNAINSITNETLSFKQNGEYNISKPIIIRKPIKIKGNNATINFSNMPLHFTTGTIGSGAFTIYGTKTELIDGVNITDLNFVDEGETNHNYPLFIRYAKNIKIDKIDFKNIVNGMIIMGQGVKNVIIEKITSFNCFGGIQLMSYDSCKCENLTLRDIIIDKCTYNQALDIESLDTFNYPSTTVIPIDNVLIENCVVSNCTNDNAITCLSANNVSIKNNIISNCLKNGITLLGGYDILLSGNKVINTKLAFELSAPSYVVLSDNITKGNEVSVHYDNTNGVVSNITHSGNIYNENTITGIASVVKWDGQKGLSIGMNESIYTTDIYGVVYNIISMLNGGSVRTYPFSSVGSVGITNFEKTKDLFKVDNDGKIMIDNGVSFNTGGNSPENIVIANPGSIYFDVIQGDLYIKKTGTGKTGWIIK